MLRFTVAASPRKMPSVEGFGSGPEGRLKRLRKIVTGLMRHERLELSQIHANEARGYAERLIQIAMQNGDRHPPTMEMADYWLLDKDLIHKLFKVIVPRYENYTSAYTRLYKLPKRYPGNGGELALLELRGNPWPPVKPKQRDTHYLLSNILLSAARKEYYAEHRQKLHDTSTSVDPSTERDTTPQENTVTSIVEPVSSSVSSSSDANKI